MRPANAKLKNENLQYLSNHLTDIDVIWLGDASRIYAIDRPLKFTEFEYPMADVVKSHKTLVWGREI